MKILPEMKTLTLLFLGITFLLFYYKASALLDPDFGYRLRTGMLILQGQIPRIDIYSYTMPSFPYVEHALAVAALWAYLFPLIGYRGIAVIHALLATLALFIALKRLPQGFTKKYPHFQTILGKRLGLAAWFPLILAATTIIPYSGIRAQVISWVLISLFLNLVLNTSTWLRYKWVTPLLFVLWANIHGSWSAGIAIVGVVTILRSIQSRKLLISDFVITFLSLVATLLTPYGTGTWREVVLSLTDPDIRWRISEWMPIFVSVDFGFLFFFCISLFLTLKYRRNLNCESFVVYILVLIQAILSRRHVPLWIFVALPLTIEGLGQLYDEIKNIKFGAVRFQKIYSFTWVISMCMFLGLSLFAIKNSAKITENNFYPDKAVEFLRSNKESGHIFAPYEWGGYLIWKYPEEKVFIDGRMPSWRWDAPEGELSNAFDTYTKLTQGEIPYNEVFDSYDIQYLLLRPTTPRADDSITKWFDSLTNLFGKESHKFDFYQSIVDDGWEIIYQDEKSTVYKSPK